MNEFAKLIASTTDKGYLLTFGRGADCQSVLVSLFTPWHRNRIDRLIPHTEINICPGVLEHHVEEMIDALSELDENTRNRMAEHE